MSESVSTKLVMQEVIWPAVSAKRGSLTIVVIASFVLAFTQAALVLTIGPVLRHLFAADPKSHIDIVASLPEAIASRLPWLIQPISFHAFAILIPVSLGALAIVRGTSVYHLNVHQERLGLGVANAYRKRLFSGILSRPFLEIAAQSPSEWMSAVMNDVMFLQQRFTELLRSLLRDFLSVVGAFLALALIDWRSTVILSAVGIVLALVTGSIGKVITRYADWTQRRLALLASHVLDVRKRVLLIKAQQGEMTEAGRFKSSNEKYYRLVRRSILIRSSFAPVLELAGFVAFAGFFAFHVASPELVADRAEFLLQFFVALGLTLRPLRNIGEQLTRYHEARGALQRNFALLRLAPNTSQTAQKVLSSKVDQPGELEIKEMIVPTGGVQMVEVGEVSLAPGKLVAIIGQSGCGKSSVIRSLAGLIKPSVWEASKPWRETISETALVSQHPFFFSASLRENLLYGNEQLVKDKTILDELEALGLQQIADDPSMLNQSVEALSSNFSGGQLQRLVLARALLRKRSILLLDEATSALDTDVEEKVLKHLRLVADRDSRCVVMVTHRLHTLHHFDEVWSFEGPRLTIRSAY